MKRRPTLRFIFRAETVPGWTRYVEVSDTTEESACSRGARLVEGSGLTLGRLCEVIYEGDTPSWPITLCI